ncbi:PepSY domain-containing protein [Tsuneonella deserti]|nr:PepSY domain-containing protein [Tsuneonella deserti]
MTRFARWHIWLAWLTAIPVLIWTVSGLVMVARPIETVRGQDLRIEERALPLPGTTDVSEVRTFMDRGRAIALVTHFDGKVSRVDAATGTVLPSIDAAKARELVASSIRGGERVESVRAFSADEAPLELREPIATWLVSLADGTHVYVNRDTGEIEAVRTSWWRFYDLMWGLHIMDLQTREDSHNAFVVVFGFLALIGAVLGTILMFRRRRARVVA